MQNFLFSLVRLCMLCFLDIRLCEQTIAFKSCSAMTGEWIALMGDIYCHTSLFCVAGSKQQLAFLQQQVTAEKSLSDLAADFAGAHTTLQVSHSRVKFPLNSITCCKV